MGEVRRPEGSWLGVSEGKSRGRQGQGTVSKSTVRGEQKVLSRGGTGSLFLKVTGLPWGCGWWSVAALPVQPPRAWDPLPPRPLQHLSQGDCTGGGANSLATDWPRPLAPVGIQDHLPPLPVDGNSKSLPWPGQGPACPAGPRCHPLFWTSSGAGLAVSCFAQPPSHPLTSVSRQEVA